MTQFLDVDVATEEKNLKDIALSLLNAGLIPVPCIITWDSKEEKYKKILGWRDSEFHKISDSLESLEVEATRANLDQWFSSATKGIGIVCAANHEVNGKWLVKIDLDGNADKETFFRRFSGDEVAIAATVSGGLGVFCWLDRYIESGTRIYFDGVEIGNTSDFNVIPPSNGYVWLKERRWQDLRLYNVAELATRGVSFGEALETATPHDCIRYKEGLSLLSIAYSLKIYGSRDLDRQWKTYGYDDSYEQWLDLLLIGRSLSDQYPDQSHWLKNAFIEFSRSVGDISGSWNAGTYDRIDEEWEREDKGGLTIATLEQWIKGIWSDGKIQTKLNKDGLDEFKKWIGETTRGRIDTEGWISYFKKALSYTKIHPNLERQTLVDGAIKFGVKLSEFERDYQVFKRFERENSSRANVIPSWEISDDQIAGILRQFPKGVKLHQYAVDRNLNAAIFVPLYLASVSALVNKKYKRLSMSGHSIHGAMNVFLIGESGDGKSLYTNVVDCLVDQQRLIDQLHMNALKVYEWQLKQAKKDKDAELPEEPKHTQLRLSNFTYSALLDVQATNNAGTVITLDEASTMFSTDVSGMRLGTSTILANYCKVWNGDCESERRRGRGVTYSIDVKASMIAGLQIKWLKDFLKQDDNGFFARSHLIMMHPTREKDSSISQPEMKRELSEVFMAVYRHFDQLENNGQEMLWSDRIGQPYPHSEDVAKYLNEVYEISQEVKGKRAQYMNKVRNNFWRLVYAIETLYTTLGNEFSWDVVYNTAILISKWLTDCFEETLTNVACYKVDEHEDMPDICTQFKIDTGKYYRDPNNWGRPGYDWVRRAKKRTLYKELENKILYKWLDEMTANGDLQIKDKGFEIK